MAHSSGTVLWILCQLLVIVNSQRSFHGDYSGIFHVTSLIKYTLSLQFAFDPFILSFHSISIFGQRILQDWSQDYALNILEEGNETESTTEEMNYDGMGVNYDNSEEIEEMEEEEEEETDNEKKNEEGSASGDGNGDRDEDGLQMLAQLKVNKEEEEEEDDNKFE